MNLNAHWHNVLDNASCNDLDDPFPDTYRTPYRRIQDQDEAVASDVPDDEAGYPYSRHAGSGSSDDETKRDPYYRRAGDVCSNSYSGARCY